MRRAGPRPAPAAGRGRAAAPRPPPRGRRRQGGVGADGAAPRAPAPDLRPRPPRPRRHRQAVGPGRRLPDPAPRRRRRRGAGAAARRARPDRPPRPLARRRGGARRRPPPSAPRPAPRPRRRGRAPAEGGDRRPRGVAAVRAARLRRLAGASSRRASHSRWLGHPLVALAASAYKGRRRNRPQLLKLLAAIASGEDSLSRRDLARIPQETLVLWGDRDRIFPLATGRRLAAALPAARLEILPRCGHVPPTERPLAFARRVAAFLDGA